MMLQSLNPNRQQAERTKLRLDAEARRRGTAKRDQDPPKVGSLGGFAYVGSAAPTMLPCLQNPTTHYDGGGGSLISGNPLTWIDKGTTKSIYDPCPYGYRVPKNGTWAGFPSKSWTDGNIIGGAVWQSTWWPAAGLRNFHIANLYYIASRAHYWSSSPGSSIYGYHLYFDYDGTVYPSNGDGRSYGFSLRCVQE